MDSRPDSYASEAPGAAPNNPLDPNLFHSDLVPPRASFFASSPASTPRDSYVQTPSNSSPLLPASDSNEKGAIVTSDDVQGTENATSKPRRWARIFVWAIPLCVIALVLVVVLPVYFAVVKHHPHHTISNSTHPPSSSGSSGGGGGDGDGGDSGTGNPKPPTSAISGGDGSVITLNDGSTFTYSNPFGGFWVSDPQNPFNDDAQPNSWTPPLNTSWTWGRDRVYGVNIGGWFVLEPFISPALFQKYPGAVDEWTLSTLMAADTANGGLNQLEEHYDTFITEQDFAEIAGAGLNWIRVPIPFWAIDTWPGEPFLAKTSWKYILRMLGWARKYGLRVNLDLHTCPGSQNGYNHSGKFGQVNFLYGVMGVANAQRMLNYIRIITEFISQPEYQNVVPVFSIINEALLIDIGRDVLTTFYLRAHDMIRQITGTGAGHGPYICIHDGFHGMANFADFLPGSDRIILDTHPYFAFDGDANNEPIGIDGLGDSWPGRVCSGWAAGMQTSQSAFGVSIAGEWSTGYNDCGLFLRGVGGVANYGDCSLWQDASTWNATTKAGVMQLAKASMDALQDWFFWTWKIGNSLTSGIVESPLWSYKLGIQEGYIPSDPRQAAGVCSTLIGQIVSFDGVYQPWQTGGAGAGTISADATAVYGNWPPPTISGVVAPVILLPTYTSTGDVATLPPPTFTAEASSVHGGNGWFDPDDTASAPTPVAGCPYPDPWNAVNAAVPTAVCV